MKVIKMAIDRLKEAPYNPNRMKKSVFRKLVENIKKNKVYSPLIYNAQTGYVIGGNHRLRALLELGYKEVFVVEVNMSLEEEMSFSLFLNKNVGEFNQPSLPMIFDALQSNQELLAGTGFEMPEIFQIIGSKIRIVDAHAGIIFIFLKCLWQYTQQHLIF